MAKLQDLPVLIVEFRDLAKEYLFQETVGQAKKLGRFAGFSLGAAALWSAALILIGIASSFCPPFIQPVGLTPVFGCQIVIPRWQS